MSKWKIPFVANIPVEKEQEFNKKVKTEMIYEKEETRRTQVTFDNKESRLRKVADYLWEHLNEEISYKKISKDLNSPESTTKCMVAELNSFKGFPITMMPVPKKAGFIQSVLDNDADYEKWDRKKMKTITKMSMVKNKAERITESKRRQRQKVKVKNKIKNES